MFKIFYVHFSGMQNKAEKDNLTVCFLIHHIPNILFHSHPLLLLLELLLLFFLLTPVILYIHPSTALKEIISQTDELLVSLTSYFFL